MDVIHTKGSRIMLGNGINTTALVSTARLSSGITSGLMSTPATATDVNEIIDGSAVPMVADALNDNV
jgi:hypothetical protein